MGGPAAKILEIDKYRSLHEGYVRSGGGCAEHRAERRLGPDNPKYPASLRARSRGYTGRRRIYFVISVTREFVMFTLPTLLAHPPIFAAGGWKLIA